MITYQVSRTIGDAYLKRREFALDPSITRFRLSEPLRRPVLTAEPSICTRVLSLQDQFVIFASDGLWEHLTNQQAVDIVYKNPRAVCLQTFTYMCRCLFFFVCGTIPQCLG